MTEPGALETQSAPPSGENIRTIEIIPLFVARSYDDVVQATARMLDEGSDAIPGFIIRPSELEEGSGTPEELVARAIKEVTDTDRLGDIRTFGGKTRSSDPTNKELRDRRLHIDGSPVTQVGRPDDPWRFYNLIIKMQRLDEGTENVGLANPGPDTNGRLNSDEGEAELMALLEQGKTNADLMEPKVYVAEMRKDDRAVFRSNAARPTIHDFVTTSPTRVWGGTEIPVDKPSYEYRNSPEYKARHNIAA